MRRYYVVDNELDPRGLATPTWMIEAATVPSSVFSSADPVSLAAADCRRVGEDDRAEARDVLRVKRLQEPFDRRSKPRRRLVCSVVFVNGDHMPGRLTDLARTGANRTRKSNALAASARRLAPGAAPLVRRHGRDWSRPELTLCSTAWPRFGARRVLVPAGVVGAPGNNSVREQSLEEVSYVDCDRRRTLRRRQIESVEMPVRELSDVDRRLIAIVFDDQTT